MPTIPLAEAATAVLRGLADILAKPEACPDCATLQERLHQRLSSFESDAQNAGWSLEDAGAAKYALTALVDESIMLSDLPARDDWLSQPLQLRYFDEVTAGEEFYNRVDDLRAARKHDVVEVFWICLAFGFKGKHGDKRGLERRRLLMDALATEINTARGVDPRAPLSPQATAAAAAAADLPRWPLIRLPWFVMPTVAVAAVLLVWASTHLVAAARRADLAAAADLEQRP
jgi:type VI secretion system protein ImpK